jgi:uncharacterized membrane protein YbhN (UPF0104 family)
LKPASLAIKSLAFLALAAVIVFAMVRFELINLESLRSAFVNGRHWISLSFGLCLLATVVNLWRYKRLLNLLGVNVPFRGAAAATSVSLFIGQWLPGSMAISEMVRLGLMMGASRMSMQNGASQNNPLDPAASLVAGPRARIFVSSFLDRACGLTVFMSVGTVACAIALLGAASTGTVAPHELTILGGMLLFGTFGAAALLCLPWLAKHPATLRALERHNERWSSSSGKAGQLVGRVIAALKKITAPMADPAFTYQGFLGALAISLMSSLSLVGLFWCCSKAVGFEMSYLQVAAVFPFLAIAQLLPIGFGGIGGHQLVAIALFQAFSLNPTGVATASLLAGVVPLVLNAAVGMLFLPTSAGQVRAILQKAEASPEGSSLVG